MSEKKSEEQSFIDIGIDMGKSKCVICIKDYGIILSEPSIIAVDAKTGNALAIGNEAEKLLGQTLGNVRAIHPIKHGIIADFRETKILLHYFIQKSLQCICDSQRNLPLRILVAVPSGITEVENRAVRESAKHAGASEIVLVEGPMAVGVGVDLPVAEPTGSMIVDVGGGTTEVAIISLSGIVSAQSVRVGGDELDIAIGQYMKKVYNLIIDERTSERIKIEIGSAFPVKDSAQMEVKGHDLLSGLPKTVKVTAAEIRAAIQEPITSIVVAVRTALERCPPVLATDLIDRGIMLAGGGAMLSGLDKLLEQETGLPTRLANDPLNATANGLNIVLQGEGIWEA